MIQILRTPQAARFLGLSPSTLEKMRLTGDGPPFVRLGARALGYDVDELRSWLRNRRCESTSDQLKGIVQSDSDACVRNKGG